MNNNYEQLADFSIQFGGIVAFSIVCGGLIIVGLLLWLWLACIIDVYKRDFENRNIWFTVFIVSFFLTPFFMFLAAAIYYSQYRPRLKFWN